MKKKLKLNELNVQSFITHTNANEIKGGQETLICLTGTETWNFPCTNAQGCRFPTDPAICDGQPITNITNLPPIC
jgi:hypothetical protein